MDALPLQAVAGWLVTFAIHSTFALAVALLVSLALRTRWPLFQERILRFSLWVALLSTSLQIAFATTPLPMSLLDDAIPVAALSDAPIGVEPASLADDAGASQTRWAPSQILAAAALGMALLGSLWLLRTHLRLRQLLRSRQPETDGRTLAFAAEVARSLGLRQSPQVSVSAQILTPIAFGCLRPEICLPGKAGTLDDDQLRAMLAHEIAHLQRWDPLWMWLAAGVNALFPWQPLLAVARRRWSQFVELRCDAVAAGQTSPTAVARCLLDVASWLRPERRVPYVALGMAARPSALKLRVEAALREIATGRPRRAPSLCACGLSVATLTFAAPGVDATPIAAVGDALVSVDAAAGAVLPGPTVSAPRAALAMLVREREALVAELGLMRADVQKRGLTNELGPTLLLLEKSLDRVQQKCRQLAARIERREATNTPVQSR